MSNQLLASKVITEEERPAVRQIPTLDTLVMSFVGVAEKGPVNEPVLVESFTEYAASFGSYLTTSDMTASVEGFFENGGTSAYIVRVVHYSDITDATSSTSEAATKTVTTDAISATSGETTSAAGPYNLEPSQTLVIKIDGGGAQTFTFTSTAATRTSANSGTYDLAEAQTLTVAIDGGGAQTITFHASAVVNIDAVTAAEAVAIINAGLTGASASVVANAVKITSDRRGSGSGVNVTGGSANAAFAFTTGNTAGTGNASNIDAVTAAEVVAVLSSLTGATASVSSNAVRIVSSTTGASSSVQVTSGSTATAVGFDNAVHAGISAGTVDTLQIDGKYDGTYANDYRIKIGAATSGEASEFNLDVLDSTGLVLESWPNLTMDSTEARYVEDVVNEGSTRITATDLEAVGTATTRRPLNGTSTAMTGGDDGLVGLADSDYVGSSASATGLRALDTVDELTLLAVPGVATSAVHNAMITYCEVTRGGQVFAVLDPPSDLTVSQMITYVTSTAAIGGLTEYAAIYWPRIEVLNPNKTLFGKDATIPLPPSGHIAGMYARNDNAKPGGVWTQPAGTEEGKLFGVLGFEGSDASGKHPVLKEETRDLVFPKRINPITTMKGVPRYVDGARTLKGDGNWPSVGQRRGVSFAERSIKLGLQFARHKNNTPELRGDCKRTVFAFLKDQMDAGAFVTKDPATAYFVDFGDALNTVANKIVGRIGLATAQPAEFIVLKFSQDTRALDSASNS
jgi:phage tail sheath protein FI